MAVAVKEEEMAVRERDRNMQGKNKWERSSSASSPRGWRGRFGCLSASSPGQLVRERQRREQEREWQENRRERQKQARKEKERQILLSVITSWMVEAFWTSASSSGQLVRLTERWGKGREIEMGREIIISVFRRHHPSYNSPFLPFSSLFFGSPRVMFLTYLPALSFSAFLLVPRFCVLLSVAYQTEHWETSAINSQQFGIRGVAIVGGILCFLLCMLNLSAEVHKTKHDDDDDDNGLSPASFPFFPVFYPLPFLVSFSGFSAFVFLSCLLQTLCLPSGFFLSLILVVISFSALSSISVLFHFRFCVFRQTMLHGVLSFLSRAWFPFSSLSDPSAYAMGVLVRWQTEMEGRKERQESMRMIMTCIHHLLLFLFFFSSISSSSSFLFLLISSSSPLSSLSHAAAAAVSHLIVLLSSADLLVRLFLSLLASPFVFSLSGTTEIDDGRLKGMIERKMI